MTARVLFSALLLCGAGCRADIDAASSTRPWASICSLSEIKDDVPAREVFLHAILDTDLRHGALLEDPHCPSFVVEVGATPSTADGSVQVFLDDVYEDPFARAKRYDIYLYGTYKAGVRREPSLNETGVPATGHDMVYMLSVDRFTELDAD